MNYSAKSPISKPSPSICRSANLRILKHVLVGVVGASLKELLFYVSQMEGSAELNFTGTRPME